MNEKARHVGAIWIALVVGAVTAASAAPAADGSALRQAVADRTAIERIYWEDRDWPEDNGPRPTFEQAVPQETIQQRWERTLQRRGLLSSRWGIDIDGPMLQREMQRIASTTQDASRLERLFAALDHDPERIGRHLAQPLLVDRLFQRSFENDSAIHAGVRASIPEPWQGPLSLSEFYALAEQPDRLALRRAGGVGEGAAAEAVGLSDSEFNASLENLRRQLGVETLQTGLVSPLLETDSGFHRVAIEASTDDSLVALYRTWPKMSAQAWELRQASNEPTARPEAPAEGFVLPRINGPDDAMRGGAAVGCADDTWRGPLQIQPLRRVFHTAIWTGSEMIVWGGYTNGFNALNSGGRYDPTTDSWMPTSRIGAPTARGDHTAVWTGSEMLIFGFEQDGGRYNPTTDSWTPISQVNQPSPFRNNAVAVWTGTEMIVWGGFEFDGGRYNPTTDSWTSIDTLAAPDSLPYSTGVWTGSEMIVWGGGDDPFEPFNEGARYNPVTDSWTSLPFFPQQDRIYHTGVWTGTEMIVFGGQAIFFDEFGEEIEEFLNTGARYNPTTDSWTSIFSPDFTTFAASTWTGTEMIIYGGDFNSWYAQSYDPNSDFFSPLPPNAIGDRTAHTLIWTGSEAIVWGGADPFSFEFFDTGERYNPVTDSWAPMASSVTPNGRTDHTAVWTGSEMIVFGGQAFSNGNDGRYDPATNDWADLSTANIPSFRTFHTAVWTGSQMIVWGGRIGTNELNDGGRYDPATDSWSATATAGAPSPRQSHGATWTGGEMFVFGGVDSGTGLGDGGRYNPATDSWSAISTTGAPTARWDLPTVWTGSEALIWGGFNGSNRLGDGARYNPATDSWTAMTTVGAPAERSANTAVWTGSEALYWGGSNASAVLNDGGRYDPATDSWTAIATIDAPSIRFEHAAVWSGEEMLVWGGRFGSLERGDGGRYDPATDSWTAMSNGNAPAPVYSHTAVWSGDEMIVFGGRGDSATYPTTGGAYCAVSSTCTPQDWYRDADNDGVGDAGDVLSDCSQPSGYVSGFGDCDDTNGQVDSTPGVVSGLVLSHDIPSGVTTLSWNVPAAPGGQAAALLYDVLQSAVAADFATTATCAATQINATTTTDSAVPAVGGLLYFLPRAGNACPNGSGSIGADSSNTDRPARSCP